MQKGLIQIAGIHDIEEARLCESLGIRWLGFPLFLDVHTPDCSVEEAQSIIHDLQAETRPVLITYLTDPKKITEVADYLGVQWVQLHALWSLEGLDQLRQIAPTLKIIKSIVIHPGMATQTPYYQQFSNRVEAFLTDTFDPGTGASGATGKIHDWAISRDLVEALEPPVILAGGLTPHNVADAIKMVHPYGVDCHTGVEDQNGRKDPKKLEMFIQACEQAFMDASQLSRESL